MSPSAAKKSEEIVRSSTPVDVSSDDSHMPTRPPGLTPLPDERLWHPRDDEYWQQLRGMWGAHQETPEPTFQSDSEDMDDIDLRSANERTFRIAFRARIAAETAQANQVNQHSATTTNSQPEATLSSRSNSDDDSSRNKPSPQYTVMPPSSKGRRAFRGVQITTTTKTYGDFTRNNPPPYTPRPTGDERTFPPVESKPTDTKWPVTKYLFICGFLFPLCWFFGAMLLLGGLRKMCSDTQLEQESGTGSTKLDTGVTENGTVAQRIANEIKWAKRCGWAASAAICVAIIVFLVFIFVMRATS